MSDAMAADAVLVGANRALAAVRMVLDAETAAIDHARRSWSGAARDAADEWIDLHVSSLESSIDRLIALRAAIETALEA